VRLVRHLGDLPYPGLEKGSVVTIGAYDGLHLGHRKLLERLNAMASRLDLPAAVMSFEPTPKEFFGGEKPPARLMRFREKFDALADSGVDIFYCPRFAEAMRDVSAADFIRRILVHGLNARHIVVGDDFHFARKREGTIEHLRKTAPVLGFEVEQVPSVVVDGVRVSSTAIRAALAEGDLQTATALLGRPYRMSGKVVRGNSVGPCAFTDSTAAHTMRSRASGHGQPLTAPNRSWRSISSTSTRISTASISMSTLSPGCGSSGSTTLSKTWLRRCTSIPTMRSPSLL
jgi:FAD synthase